MTLPRSRWRLSGGGGGGKRSTAWPNSASQDHVRPIIRVHDRSCRIGRPRPAARRTFDAECSQARPLQVPTLWRRVATSHLLGSRHAFAREPFVRTHFVALFFSSTTFRGTRRVVSRRLCTRPSFELDGENPSSGKSKATPAQPRASAVHPVATVKIVYPDGGFPYPPQSLLPRCSPSFPPSPLWLRVFCRGASLRLIPPAQSIRQKTRNFRRGAPGMLGRPVRGRRSTTCWARSGRRFVSAVSILFDPVCLMSR